jgi:hypothetical protein
MGHDRDEILELFLLLREVAGETLAAVSLPAQHLAHQHDEAGGNRIAERRGNLQRSRITGHQQPAEYEKDECYRDGDLPTAEKSRHRYAAECSDERQPVSEYRNEQHAQPQGSQYRGGGNDQLGS